MVPFTQHVISFGMFWVLRAFVTVPLGGCSQSGAKLGCKEVANSLQIAVADPRNLCQVVFFLRIVASEGSE